jgi:hypothetical protein
MTWDWTIKNHTVNMLSCISGALYKTHVIEITFEITEKSIKGLTKIMCNLYPEVFSDVADNWNMMPHNWVTQ